MIELVWCRFGGFSLQIIGVFNNHPLFTYPHLGYSPEQVEDLIADLDSALK